MKTEVWARRPTVINTDPQRRCYNGCNFSEETVWSTWALIAAYPTQEDAADSAATFKRANPTHEYDLRPIAP